MKTASLPPLRVVPELRSAAERVLREDESLSSFVEESVRSLVERRQLEREFIARGLASRENSRASGQYFSKSEVMASLKNMLKKAEQRRKKAR